MANEIEITITGRDLSGPAFASAADRLSRLRAQAEGLRQTLSSIVAPDIDSSKLTASLIGLRAKMQALGIADIADVNVQPGRIMTQLNLLKRLIGQSGISDILDVNVNEASLASARIRAAAAFHGINVPVGFDVSHFPVFGPHQNIAEHLRIDSNAGVVAAQLETIKELLRDIPRTITTELSIGLDEDSLRRLIGMAGGPGRGRGGGRGGGFLGGLLGGLLRGGGGGGGGTILGALGLGGTGAAGIGGVSATVGIGAVAAALAALPFLAATVGSAIVGALGAGMATLGIVAAAKTKPVADAFANLQSDAAAQLNKISKPFDAVLVSILNTADAILPKIFTPLGTALNAMAGPLQAFGDTFVRSFAQPAVAQAITQVGKAFDMFLRAFTPQIPGIANAIAGGINGMAEAFTAHPGMVQAMTDVLAFLLKLPGYVAGALGSLTRFANWIATGFPHEVSIGLDATRTSVIGTGHDIEATFNTVQHDISVSWNVTWNNTVARAARGVADTEGWFHNLQSGASIAFATARADIASAWDTTWANTVARANAGVNSVVAFVGRLPGELVARLGDAGHVLLGWGKGVIQGLLDGMTSVIGSVWDFIKSIPGKILHFLGWHSPPDWAIQAGKDIMNGLGIGMNQAQSAFAKASSAAAAAAQAVIGGVGGGGFSATAQQAQAYARSLFPSHGWGADQWASLLALWNRESGWSASARNPSSGAAGIPQDISGNFHGGYKGQVVWGENYIAGRYGNPAGAWAHEVGFGWYDSGGWLKPGWTMAYNATGRSEQVIPPGGGQKIEIVLSLDPSIPAGLGRELLESIRYTVRTVGGGNVQKAFGRP